MAIAPEQRRQLGDAAEVVAACDRLEADLAELRAAYEQYFLGIERRPPVDRHKALTADLKKLRGTFVRQTGAKFRVQALQQKVSTYERLWSRTLQEMENGTYVRDLKKAARRRAALQAQEAAKGAGQDKPKAKPRDDDDFSIDEVDPEEAKALLSGAAFDKPKVAPVAPPVAPGRIAAAAPRSAPVSRPAAAPASGSGGGGAVSDDKLRAVYDAFVKAKKRCNEDVSKLSYDQVAQSLRKQVPELMKKHNARAVEFKVVIKDGKAVLRAVPRE